MPNLLRTDREITEIYYRNVDSVYRVCYSFMKNKPETEDMVQETFLRLISKRITFQNEKHEKAWLIVTASNICKDALKRQRRKEQFIDDVQNLIACTNRYEEVLEAVLGLPEDYKTVVYMYYYEGYSTGEIAKYLHRPQATVRSWLMRARNKLKDILGGDENG